MPIRDREDVGHGASELRKRKSDCVTAVDQPPGRLAELGTVTLIEKCSGAVGFEAVATDHRWVVHISGGSVGHGDLTPDREAVAQLVGVGLPELGAPPDRLVTHRDTAYQHQLLDLTKAEREPEVQPHAVMISTG